MKQKNKDVSQEETIKGSSLPKPQKSQEISEEALQARQLLGDLLVRSTNDIARADELKRQRNNEVIELLNGKKITLQQIRDIVLSSRQPYESKFGRDIDFFPQMYRLLGWTDKDPHAYSKPGVVGDYINQILYARFAPDVRPALQALAVPGGVRMDKFFQYLTAEGMQMLEQFRDEAIAMMKQCTTWYEFRVKYGQRYGLSVQSRMFEAHQG
ncbi:hypothetical protein A4D02_33630 [Niastella koreensis]|uniref:Bacteriophage Mx8 p63 C-terminal domain-containing protein n=2 Tax=Niastella koreensis TaxID=354356 RepID=G8TAH1_NIAKG|nr:P63C domain-containing protein [Niastella koreensis]AEV98133.1 protein of unknown function P63C-containing protein [Niastella koreensis GR20-10]OQP45341.1 hypothetical protein A4D02_33630 [Niastella koreensis]